MDRTLFKNVVPIVVVFMMGIVTGALVSPNPRKLRAEMNELKVEIDTFRTRVQDAISAKQKAEKATEVEVKKRRRVMAQLLKKINQLETELAAARAGR